MNNFSTIDQKVNATANRLAAFWPRDHKLSITAAVSLVAEKNAAAFAELASAQRETDAIAVLSDALVSLGQPGIQDGREVGGTREQPQRHRLHAGASTIHNPLYWGAWMA
jgi:hypothetical protein